MWTAANFIIEGSASLVDCTQKKFFCLRGAVFMWVTS